MIAIERRRSPNDTFRKFPGRCSTTFIIHIEGLAVKYMELRAPSAAEDSAAVREGGWRHGRNSSRVSVRKRVPTVMRRWRQRCGRRKVAGERGDAAGAFGTRSRPHPEGLANRRPG